MGKPSAPEPPSPKETSAAQTGTNIGTAIANNAMGMVDQYTPYGSLTYETVGGPGAGEAAPTLSVNKTRVPTKAGVNPLDPFGQSGGFTTEKTFSVGDKTFDTRADALAYQGSFGGGEGGFSYTDPYTGKTYNIPRYKATTTLTPEQQQILDATNQTKINLSELASERSDFLRDYLPNTEAATDQIDSKLYDLGSKRLDPRFAQEEDALRTRLANQGLTMGSEAYNRELERFGQGKNDAYNQLLLNGRNQAMSEVNMPINQIIGLMSGSQIQNPNVQMQQPQGAATTDVAGLINQNYNQRYNNWQQQNAQRQGVLGGLFGLGAGALQGGIF